MAAKLEIRQIGPDEFARWDEFVDSCQGGCLFNKTRWAVPMARATGERLHVLVAEKGQHWHGGMVCFSVRAGGLRYARAPLATPYLGPLVWQDPRSKPDRQTAQFVAVLEVLIAHAEEQFDLLALQSHPSLSDLRPFFWASWDVTPIYTYYFDLNDLEGARGRICREHSRMIRRAASAGVVVDSRSDFDAFYRLYLATYDRQEKQLEYPESVYRQVIDAYDRAGLLRWYFARHEGRDVGAFLTVVDGPVAYAWLCGADPAALHLGVNQLLHWTTVERSAAEGCRCYDYVGAQSKTVAMFKSQFGCKLVPYHSLRRTRSKSARLQRWLGEGKQLARALVGAGG